MYSLCIVSQGLVCIITSYIRHSCRSGEGQSTHFGVNLSSSNISKAIRAKRRFCYVKPPPSCVIARLAAPSRATDGVRALPPPDPASQAPLGSPVPEATLAGGLRPPFRTVRAPQSCGAGASKTQVCRTARRARGARAASRARCASSARDMFFVRPNATGHDLPSPRLRSRREASRDKPWRGTSSSSSSWIRRASHAARAATAQPAHPDHARIAHAAHICCVQVLLARTHPVPTCPPPRGRARSTGRRGAAVVCPRLA